MGSAAFKIDLKQKFTHLQRAPIVEAVIHWQARAQKWPQPDVIESALHRELPGYSSCEPVQKMEFAAMMTDQSAPVVRHQKDWHGFRLTSDDQRHVIQFTRDGVSFSRIQHYEDWLKFSTAAKRAWQAFVAIAAPVEVQRLGVRFINHFPAATLDSLADYLSEPPTCPANFPLSEFVYQSTFTVPEQPYGIQIIKVMQSVGIPQSSGLFLDCDVHSTKPIPCDEREVDEALAVMRWLKNKVFFSLVTLQTVEECR